MFQTFKLEYLFTFLASLKLLTFNRKVTFTSQCIIKIFEQELGHPPTPRYMINTVFEYGGGSSSSNSSNSNSKSSSSSSCCSSSFITSIVL